MSDKQYEPLLHIEEVLPIINTIAIFGGLSEQELYTLFRLLKSVGYSEGERIFEQGEEATHIYIIQKGSVKLVIDIDTEPLELAEMTSGQCFGESSVIGIQPHSVTAVATTDTTLIVLTSEALLDLYNSDSGLFGKLILNIAREACRRLHKADETLLHYVAKGNRD